MLDIRANDKHFSISLDPETIRSAWMIVPLSGDYGFHIVDAGEVFAGISNLQELEIGSHVIQLHREIFHLHLDFENLPQIADCLISAERQQRDFLPGIVSRGKEREALNVVPVKVRERDDDLVLLMADGAKVSAQISQSRARVNDDDSVRIGEGDLQAGGVTAELLKTGIADGDGSPCAIKLKLHRIVLRSQASGWKSSNGTIDCLQCPCSAQLQIDWCCQLELQPGLRVNHRCAGGMSVVRLSRCLRRARRLDAARLYWDPASIYINRGEFHSERPGFARIGTRGRDLSKRFGSSFQYNVSLDRNVLRNLCLEASARDSL